MSSPVDPTSLEFSFGIITELITIVSAIIFAALFLERRTNTKIQDAKDEVTQDLKTLEQKIKDYIESKHEISKERMKFINDTIERLDKQIERLESMSFQEYYKKFFIPRSRRGEHSPDDTDTLPSK